MIKVFLDNKAQVNVADWEGVTPLIAAARIADAKLLGMLLTAGPDIEANDQRAEHHCWEVVGQDSVEIVKVLLSKHARITVFDKGGNSPLIRAAGRGYPEGAQITKLLLDSGADPNLANSGDGLR